MPKIKITENYQQPFYKLSDDGIEIEISEYELRMLDLSERINDNTQWMLLDKINETVDNNVLNDPYFGKFIKSLDKSKEQLKASIEDINKKRNELINIINNGLFHKITKH